MKPQTFDPDDICECGDRYREHESGGGACDLNGLGHHITDPKLDKCHKFRFAWDAATEKKHEERRRNRSISSLLGLPSPLGRKAPRHG